MSAVLQVRDLTVRLHGVASPVVAGASFEVAKGEVFGIAGESGCGKTQLLLALLGLKARGASVTGSAMLAGLDLVRLSQRELTRLRGDRIAMVFQDPLTALNPYLTVGTQLTEVLRVHRRASRRAATEAAAAMLATMQIADPGRRLAQYPHQLSGGQRQRVVLAMALLCEPDVLLADEPTTALDATVQAQILALLAESSQRLGTAVVLVTHDFGVLASVAHRVAVMQRGRIVEQGGVDALFASPAHEATRGLLTAARELSLPEAVT